MINRPASQQAQQDTAEHPLLVLIDGHALVYRAYHALGTAAPTKGKEANAFTLRKTGEPVFAVFGFANMLLKVLADLRPQYFAVAFDTPHPTFRHDSYDQYKATRSAAPPDLAQQFTWVRKLVEAFGIPIFELPGYEADDLLGTFSRQAKEQGIETIIVTGDGDAMQLVSPGVRVLYPGRTLSDAQLFDEEMVREKYGVYPDRIADLKGFKGDPSDNIPGVPGVGEKTALKLLDQFGSLEGVYENLAVVGPARLQELLRTHEKIARKSKQLAIIDSHSPFPLDLEACRFGGFDRERLVALLRELEFTSLLGRIPQSTAPAAPPRPEQLTLGLGALDGPQQVIPEVRYHVVTSQDDLDALATRMVSPQGFAFATETTSHHAMTGGLVGISVACEECEAFYVPVGHLDGTPQLPLQQVLDALRPALENAAVPKVAHNAKFAMIVLAELGVNVRGLAGDTIIAAYLLGEKSIGLKELAFRRLGVETMPITNLIGTGGAKKQISIDQAPVDQTGDYACAETDMTLRLRAVLEPELRERDLWPLYTEIELPLVPVLVAIERTGVALDVPVLQEMSQNLGQKIHEAEDLIYQHAGGPFTINSPQQLGKVLFDQLGLASRGKTKTGAYSTDAHVLETLRGEHEVVDLVLDYRQLTKLKSTYVDALPVMVHPKTGRLHTNFNQTIAATGRLSSQDPNLQNIPIRTELGRQVRTAFVADGPEPMVLLSADYSQIELRILAHISGDERLLASFANDEDIHSATAAEVYGVPADGVTSAMRRIAKVVNFGVAYGLSSFGLAERVPELNRTEAQAFIKAYFERYPGVQQYIVDIRRFALERGYVQSLTGRRRYLPEIYATNPNVRGAAERMAVNMPVQGLAADIIKIAMIRLQQRLQERRLVSRMLLQVHDELVLEVAVRELEEIERIVPAIMEGAMVLAAPLKVDVKVGNTWGELERVTDLGEPELDALELGA